jgi:hypothetical protein
MKRFGRGILYALVAYVPGAIAGYGLILVLSSNSHDRSLEAAMTGAFVCGPLCALVAFIVGLARRPRGRSR